MTFTLPDPAAWAELNIYTWGENGDHNGSITAYDGDRHYTIADIEASGLLRVRDYEIYPASVQHFFPEPVRRQARLMDMELFFDGVVNHMRNLTGELGYPPHTWAAAMVLRQESWLMQAVHGAAYTDYTFEQCLAVIAQFRPRYTFQQLGILIDHGMSPEVLLGYDGTVSYGLLTELYPSVRR